MSTVDATPGAACAGKSDIEAWEVYLRSRPEYPKSLENLIIDYHISKGGRFDAAHDIGAGCGIYSKVLAEHFSHVHVSDADESAIDSANEALMSWQYKTRWKGTFDFADTPAEQSHACTAPASVDLAVLMESAHWTKAEDMITSIANILVPGGTLAIVLYSPICTVLSNDKVNSAVQRLYHAWASRDIPEQRRPLVVRGQRQISLGTDFVPLPNHLYRRDMTRRITINTHGRGSRAFMVDEFWNCPWDTSTHEPDEYRKVVTGEKEYEYSTQDIEGEGWVQEVDASFFREEISTIVHDDAMLEQFEPYFVEIEKLLDETEASRTVRVEWKVAILLATRR